jgi:hypothetical protein
MPGARVALPPPDPNATEVVRRDRHPPPKASSGSGQRGLLIGLALTVLVIVPLLAVTLWLAEEPSTQTAADSATPATAPPLNFREDETLMAQIKLVQRTCKRHTCTGDVTRFEARLGKEASADDVARLRRVVDQCVRLCAAEP